MQAVFQKRAETTRGGASFSLWCCVCAATANCDDSCPPLPLFKISHSILVHQQVDKPTALINYKLCLLLTSYLSVYVRQLSQLSEVIGGLQKVVKTEDIYCQL